MTETHMNEELSLYERLYNRVEELRKAGFTPNKIVVPAGSWEQIKDDATVVEGTGTLGGDKTLINDVRVTWVNYQSSARIILEEPINE